MSKTTGFVKEFREFAIKGNMIDLAVGVIIGGAFSKIIDSIVRDVIMPIISFVLGGEVDFANEFTVLRLPEGYTGAMTLDELNAAGAVILAWGNFLTIFINFILLALVVFMMVKGINRMRQAVHHEEAAAPAEPAPTPEDVVLLREIRDALKNKNA